MREYSLVEFRVIDEIFVGGESKKIVEFGIVVKFLIGVKILEGVNVVLM